MSDSRLIHSAAKTGDLDTVKQCIEAGDDVNRKDYPHDTQSLTPLHYASMNAHIDTVELLIDNGADLNIDDGVYGYTALHYACRNSHEKVAKMLITRGADININKTWSPLYIALIQGNETIIKLLIENDANTDSISFDQKSLLHVAVKQDRDDILELLIDKAIPTEDP